MRHIEWNLKRVLDKACVILILIPRDLVNEFLDAALFDSIDIGLAALDHFLKDRSGGFGMAIENTPADQLAATILRKGDRGLVVHVEDYTIPVTNRNGDGRSIRPGDVVHVVEGLGVRVGSQDRRIGRESQADGRISEWRIRGIGGGPVVPVQRS